MRQEAESSLIYKTLLVAPSSRQLAKHGITDVPAGFDRDDLQASADYHKTTSHPRRVMRLTIGMQLLLMIDDAITRAECTYGGSIQAAAVGCW